MKAELQRTLESRDRPKFLARLKLLRSTAAGTSRAVGFRALGFRVQVSGLGHWG